MRPFCKAVSIVLVFILFSACSNKTPEDIAEQYWLAIFDGDYEALQSIVTEDSVAMINTIRIPEPGSQFSLDRVEKIDEGQVDIETTVTLVQGDSITVNNINTVLIKENGQWKVGLRQTRRALYASLLQNSFAEMGDSLQQGAIAVEELGIQLANNLKNELDQGLIEASKEIQEQAQQASEALQEAIEEIEDELIGSPTN